MQVHNQRYAHILSVVITGIDSMDILEQAFEAARKFHPMSDQEEEAKLASARYGLSDQP
jgi:hypothetical protein